MLDITIIPAEVKHLAQKAAAKTQEIETALKSNVVVDLAALFPGGTQLDQECIALCEGAIKGCNALIAVADNAGLNGRLQRLGSDLVKLQHDSSKHTISWYITAFEIVFADLMGKSVS
jgi:hypothetical protein